MVSLGRCGSNRAFCGKPCDFKNPLNISWAVPMYLEGRNTKGNKQMANKKRTKSKIDFTLENYGLHSRCFERKK